MTNTIASLSLPCRVLMFVAVRVGLKDHVQKLHTQAAARMSSQPSHVAIWLYA